MRRVLRTSRVGASARSSWALEGVHWMCVHPVLTDQLGHARGVGLRGIDALLQSVQVGQVP